MSHINLDHIIVNVNDIESTLKFWKTLFDFKTEGQSGPFTVLRITPDLTFQFAPWGTDGGSHFAFCLEQDEFEKMFTKLKELEIPYGDSFHTVGTQTGPGLEEGAKGMGKSIYFFDPNRHLLEIRTYET